MPAALDDPKAPTKHLSGPERKNYHPERIIAISTILRDNTKAIITPYINGYHDAPSKSSLQALCSEMNKEIDAGNTYPMDEAMDLEGFAAYWFGNFAAI